jgi:CDP-diacylglycerol--glycerol-3-phosphate 3-phosphatidyltransferase
MANLLTSSRLVLLVAVVWLFYVPQPAWQMLNFVLIIVLFVTDGLDGYVARKRNEASHFGALWDIASDRVVELSLWVVAADQNLVPIWVPLVFITRGVVVDTIRASDSATRREAPFDLMRTPFGKFIVAGRFMRIFYAVIKACAFCGLAVLHPFPAVWPAPWALIGPLWTALTYACVYVAVSLCLIRGMPVVAEFVQAQKDAIVGNSAGK